MGAPARRLRIRAARARRGHSSATRLHGEPPGAPRAAVDWDADPDWDGAVDRSCARIVAALIEGGLDQPAHVCAPDGRHASLRRLLCDLVEEYGRHTGHADLLRESVDGLVGEEPPEGWHA